MGTLRRASLACRHGEEVASRGIPMDVWSIRPLRAPFSPIKAVSSISSYCGPSSIIHQPSAITSVVGQLVPLVHGHAGRRHEPSHQPPLSPSRGSSPDAVTVSSQPDPDPQASELLLLLEQRRCSHADASSSSPHHPGRTLHKAVAGDGGPPSPPESSPGTDPIAAADAAAWADLRPTRRGTVGSPRLTPTQAAVQLLQIAESHLQLPTPLGDTALPPPPPPPPPLASHSRSRQRLGSPKERKVSDPPGPPGGDLRAALGPPPEQLEAGKAAPGGPPPPGQPSAPGAPPEMLVELDRLALRKALDLVQPALQRLSVVQLQRCLETLAAAGYTPSDPWVIDYLAASEQLLPTADATEVYGIVAAMRALRVRPQRPQWLAAAVAALGNHLAQLSPQQVVDLFLCFADLTLRPPDAFLSRALALLLPDLPQLQPRLILELLYGCSKMRCTPPPYVLAASYQALTPAALAAAPPAQLCRLAAPLAALRPQPPPPPGLLFAVVARADKLLRQSVTAGAPTWQDEEGDGLAAAEAAAAGAGEQGEVAAAEPAAGQGLGTRMLRPRRGGRQQAGRGNLGMAGLEPSSSSSSSMAAASEEGLRLGRGSGAAAGSQDDRGMAPGDAVLSAQQLSCLLRDLRTLSAPLPPDWGPLCGAFLLRCTDMSTPVLDVSYLLGSISRCGLDLDPHVVRVVALRLTGSLQAAAKARRRRDSAASHDPLVSPPDPPPAAKGDEERLGAASEGENSEWRPCDHEHGQQRLGGSGGEGGARTGESGASTSQPGGDDAVNQWTPQTLSTATSSLVPFAAHLPPAFLRALYVNLYDTLERFDLPQLTATLHALPRLAAATPAAAAAAPPPPPQPLLQSYLSCLRGRMPRMAAWQLSMCIFALCRLRVRPDPPWMDAFLGQVFRSLPQMNEVQVATVAWVVAKLSYRPLAGWVDRLLAAAAGRLSCFSPRHLCQLLWAVGAMGYRPSGAWMERWLDKARAHFRTSDGRTLATLTWTLACVGYPPGAVWMQDLCQHLVRRLPYTSPRAVANTLAAVAALGYQPGEEWLDAVAAHVCERVRSYGSGTGGGLFRRSASGSAAAPSGGYYNLRDLSYTCHGLARLGYRPNESWTDAVVTAAAIMARAGPTSNNVDGGSADGDGDGDGDDALWMPDGSGGMAGAPPHSSSSAAAAAAGAAAAAAAHAQYIAVLTQTLARLRWRPSATTWSALLDGLRPCLSHAAPHSLGVLLAAAATLRLPLPREQTGAVLLATHRRMDGFSGRALAMTLRAFVELGVHPGHRWLARLEEVLAQRWEEQQRQMLAWQAGRRQLLPQQEDGHAEEEGWGPLGAGLTPPPPPPHLLLSPSDRCSLLWSVVTLETSRLEEPSRVAPSPAPRGPSAAPDSRPVAPSPSALTSPLAAAAARPTLPQMSQLSPSLTPSSAAAPTLPLPQTPLHWIRKSSPTQRPPQLAGLLALLLPRPAPILDGTDGTADDAAIAVGPSAFRSEWAHLADFSGQDLGTVCWALGRLRVRPQGLVAALVDEVRQRLTEAAARAVVQDPHPRTLGPRALCLAFGGLSSIGIWPTVPWRTDATAEVLRQARAGALAPQQVATLLCALAKWGREPRVQRRRCDGVPRTHGSVLGGGQRRFRSRLVLRGREPSGGQSSQGEGSGNGLRGNVSSGDAAQAAEPLATAMRSGATGGRKSRWVAAAAGMRRSEGRLRAVTIALAEWAVADSVARMPPRLPGHAASVTEAAFRPGAATGGGSGVQTDALAYKYDMYDARSLANLLWALANLGATRRLPEPWVVAFMPVSLGLLAQRPPSYRVTLLDSLSRLGLRPGRAWLDGAEQVVLSSGLALASSSRGLELALLRMSGPEKPPPAPPSNQLPSQKARGRTVAGASP